MNVLYNTSIADPFVQVAQKLQKENGLDPVYWIGFDYDHSDEIVPLTFPNCVYQSYTHAWRGIFNEEVIKKSNQCYLDIDFLNEFARYELQAIKMMDRMDFDRYSFNFMERERHYHHLLKCWMAVLELYKPDLIVSAVNPHRVYDYVLYLLCKKQGIPFINLQYSMCRDWIWSNMNIYSVGDKFENSYNKYLSEGNLTKEDLPVEIREQYEKVLKDYKEAVPDYMKKHASDNKKQFNIFSLCKIYLNKYKLFGKNGLLSNRSVQTLMRKRKGYSLEEGRNGLYESINQKLKQISYCKKMRNLYESLTVEPVKGEDYILFPLHYQPEETTSPSGDMFVNQLLCIETLLKNTPPTVFIYVKEHPTQYMPQMLGQTCRIKEFYTDLIKNPRIKLMSLELDTYSLMRNAKAVATVTGTVGWEAIMHRIPVIIFGMIWYEKMPGVLRITDSNSASKIEDFISHYSYDEQKVLSYLMAFAENSFKAYHYDGRKKRMNLDEETCVNNIVSEVLKSLK